MHSAIRRLRGSLLAKNTFWMFMGQGLRIFVQAGYFVMIARLLHPSEYGIFGAVLALAAILAPFASVGCGTMVIKNVVYDPKSFRSSWGNAAFVTVTCGTLMVGAMTGVAYFALPSSTPLTLILSVGIADVIAAPLAHTAAECFQAFEKLAFTAALELLPSVARTICAAYLFVSHPHSTAQEWATYYMDATLVSALISYFVVGIRLGYPKLKLSKIPGMMAEGWYFSIGMCSQTIYNDIDKMMLARLSTLDAAGIYITAYRICDMAFVPVRSLVFASYARFFEHGKAGLDTALKYARKLMSHAMAYSVVIGIFLLVIAPILPRILGAEYARSVLALRLLAVLPFLKSIHYFFSQTLIGAGYQGVRSIVQVSIAVLNVLANLWIIPRYSWQGAAWISIVCDSSLAAGLYLALICCKWSERRKDAIDAPLRQHVS